MQKLARHLGLICTMTATSALSAMAGSAITDDQVTFAQVAVLEGPAAALGTGVRAGIQAAFDEANAKRRRPQTKVDA